MSQLEALGLDNVASRSFMPSCATVRPVAFGEERCVDASTGFECIRLASGAVLDIIPDDFCVDDVFIVSNTIDRGSTGAAATNFACQALTWTVRHGVMHDCWNAVRTSAKKWDNGSVWRSIVRAAAIQNMPYGPFRSGAWGKKLQEVHVESVKEDFQNSSEFITAVENQCLLLPTRFDGSLNRGAWWNYFCRIPLCHRAPTVLKFARWGSINECWAELRADIFFVPLLVSRMTGQELDTSKEATTHWNAEVANQAESRTGLLKRIPAYVTIGLCDALDCFCHVTDPIRLQNGLNLQRVKDPQQAVEVAVADANGAYEDVLLKTAGVLYRLDLTAGLCGSSVHPARTIANTKMLFGLCSWTMSELLVRLWPAATQWPGLSSTVLATPPETALEWVTTLAADWRMLTRWEQQAATGSLKHKRVLDSLTWREHPLARLFYELCVRASHDPGYLPAVQDVSRRINERLLDEKVPEDLHQHIRDTSRGQRAKRAKLKKVFDSSIRSGVLESRNVDHARFVPDDQAVAMQSWREASRHTPTRPITGQPSDWPKALNGILCPDRDWPSPTVHTLFSSAMAWCWMKNAEYQPAEPEQSEPDDPHWSRLVRRHVLCELDIGKIAVVLASADWGVFVHSCETVSSEDGTFKLQLTDDPLLVAFVVDPRAWTVYDAEPCHVVDVGTCFRKVGDGLNVLQDALLHRVPIAAWQQHRGMELLGAVLDGETSHWDLSGKSLLHALSLAAFDGDEARAAAVLEAHDKPTEDDGDDEWDAEYEELLEELTVQDSTNAEELSHLKSERKKKANARLVARKKKATADRTA